MPFGNLVETPHDFLFSPTLARERRVVHIWPSPHGMPLPRRSRRYAVVHVLAGPDSSFCSPVLIFVGASLALFLLLMGCACLASRDATRLCMCLPCLTLPFVLVFWFLSGLCWPFFFCVGLPGVHCMASGPGLSPRVWPKICRWLTRERS